MSGDAPRDGTDLAVALTYEAPAAPRVTAVGHGELARRIVETARANGVPLEDNPMLAVALSQVPLGAPIPDSLYKAVAEVLAFILRTSGKLR